MTTPKLLLAAALRFKELREKCRHSGGDECAEKMCRGWVPKEPHLEDVLAMMAKRGYTSVIYGPGTLLNVELHEWTGDGIWVVSFSLLAEASERARHHGSGKMTASTPYDYGEAPDPVDAALQAALATKEDA